MSQDSSRALLEKLEKYEAEGVYPFFVIVNAVIFKEDKVLIARRASHDAHAPGKWCIPGGKLEVGADQVFNAVQSTLAREVMEEVGVEVSSDYRLVANNTFKMSDGRRMIALVFTCDWVAGEAESKDLNEVDKVAWITADELGSYEFANENRDYIEAALQLRNL